jgi:Restriction endonuclease FokI, C terminal
MCAMYMNSWNAQKNKRKLTGIRGELLHFLEICEDKEWSGNRELQREYETLLESNKLKGGGNPRDINSGGARTYQSQIETLGLVFLDTNMKTPIYRSTLAGEAIINGKNPIHVLKYQLLKMQYPSPYSINRNVKISPQFKIRPFLFILKLLLDNDIEYISKEECGRFIIVYGLTEDSFSYVKELILAYRKDSGNHNLPATFMEDSNSTKTKKHSLEKRISYLEDKAITLFNYLDSAQLVIRTERPNKIYINPDSLDSIKEFINMKIPLIPYNGDIDYLSFQRKYGAYPLKKKDTRLFENKTVTDDMLIEAIIMEAYLEVTIQKIAINNDHIINDIYDKTGRPKETICRILDNILPDGLSNFENNYLEMAQNGKISAIEFEKATAEIFSTIFRYTVSHVGQIKPKSDSNGGNTDVIFTSDTEYYCGLIDTKAIKNYQISNNDKNKLIINHIPNAKEHSNGKPIKAFIYVSCSFKQAFNARIAKVVSEIGIHGCGITANNLIRLMNKVRTHCIDHLQLIKLFSIDREITSLDIDNISHDKISKTISDCQPTEVNNQPEAYPIKLT